MREQDPRVPEEVEEYLVGLTAGAGELGGSIGGGFAGAGWAGGRGGARGGARAGRRLKTALQERAGVAPGTREEVMDRVVAATPEAQELESSGDLVRFVVPVGRTGLQQVVVDLVFEAPTQPPNGPGVQVRLRAYAKEGLINRKPSATVADRVWLSVTG